MMYADFIDEVDEFSQIEWIFFAVFTFFITIVLMNLLIAIISDTYIKTMANVFRNQNAQLCAIVLEFETFLFWRRVTFLGGGEKHYPMHLVYAEYTDIGDMV
jgi:hypothetical protein